LPDADTHNTVAPYTSYFAMTKCASFVAMVNDTAGDFQDAPKDKPLQKTEDRLAM